MPELIGSRADLAHAKYKHGEPAYDLFGVSIAYSSKGSHTINAPTENTPLARKLRRFGLSLSRFALPDVGDKARKLGLPATTIRAASRAAAAGAYRHAFGDGLTTDVLSGVQFTNALNAFITTGSGSKAAMVDLLSMSTDEEFVSSVLEAVRQHHKGTEYETVAERLTSILSRHSERLTGYRLGIDNIKRLEHMNKPKHRWERREGIKEFNRLARELDMYSESLASWAARYADERRTEQERKEKPEVPQRVASIVHSDRWETLIVAKPQLTVSHTGKLGRRTVRSNEGKHPRYIDRLVTDPERRMFTRRTRSLGAVVVLDCSGSMGWDDEQLDQLISVCAGATVFAYSSDRSPTTPNAWVVAKRNQRVRHLPDFPGGNGVDGPALMWAIRNLRYSSSSPVIWVSDGQVTGKYDSSSAELRREVKQICQKYGVLVAEDAPSAIRLVKRLQGKTR
jgi:hypothetical protein